MRSLEKTLLFLLVSLLPSQLGFHFWPSWSLVYGFRVDYLSPTLYLTDILIIFLIILSRTHPQVPNVAIPFFVLNLAVSISPLNTFFFWLRFFELFLLFKYLLTNFKQKSQLLASSLGLAATWVSALAWLQLLFQRSLGGILYWLGERTFDLTTPGIAKISLFGRLFLRPYATLPHPNALAGFLLVSGLIVYRLRPSLKGPLLVVFLTVPITFSRTAIVCEVLILFLFFLRKAKYSLAGLFAPLFFLVFLFGNPESLSERLTLLSKSLSLIRQFPFLGVGLGNFIVSLPHDSQLLLQPVHNVFLLLAAELGVPAAIAILLVTKKYFFKTFSPALLIVILTGLVDHYWLTLHQTQLLLVLLISLLHVQIA